MLRVTYMYLSVADILNFILFSVRFHIAHLLEIQVSLCLLIDGLTDLFSVCFTAYPRIFHHYDVNQAYRGYLGEGGGVHDLLQAADKPSQVHPERKPA